MTKDINQTITVEIIPPTCPFNKAFDVESFKKFHDESAAKSKGDLKPVEIADINNAAYAVIATNERGKQVGQCLLFNAESGADKIAPYLDHLQEQASGTLILTSVTHLQAAPAILQEILNSTALSGKAICAKTKSSNINAKKAFETAGFDTKGPMTVGKEDYQSYFYHGKNNTKPMTKHITIEHPHQSTTLSTALAL